MGDLYGCSVREIRRNIHRNPEVSGSEKETASYIAELLDKVQGIKIYRDVGMHGVVALKKYGEGPAVGFRAELDALPVDEESASDYKSQNEGKSHACGHDGHMAMVLKALENLENAKTDRGTAVFFFQSAEETGEGAEAMIDALSEQKIKLPELSVCLALHNIPGAETGVVVLREGTFACGSSGIEVTVQGRTAHAAHPEDAVNPLNVAVKLINYAEDLPKKEEDIFSLSTSIALKAGERTFGTTPKKAVLLLTVRSEDKAHLKKMMDCIGAEANILSGEVGANAETAYHEYFPPTVNGDFTETARKACEKAGLRTEHKDRPFRWSEDFAWFSEKYPTFYAGIGSGVDRPALHAADFDFPDELIEKGGAYYAEMFKIFTR